MNKPSHGDDYANDITPAEIEEAVRWRRHLHARPELAFEEHETSAFVARELAGFGYEVHTGLGRTGVVGTLRKGSGSRTIGLRADMDALPILEATGVDYQSRVPGKMHACGHDGHTATLLAAARLIARTPFDGTVHLIFQPAEENEGGAREMIADGLLRLFPLDAAYGMHNWPGMDVGICAVREGPMMAASGTFEITVAGRGAHGAMPHQGADPVVAASAVVGALQTIASRNVPPIEAGVVSVTQIHGGDTWNVIPEAVVLRGTTRWFRDAVGEVVRERLHTLAASVAAGYGCRADVVHKDGYPATVNNDANVAVVRQVAARPEVGLRIAEFDLNTASEDFAFILREVPGAYFMLGGKREGENPNLHSPRFDFNDAIIPHGARFWRELVRVSLPA
ncbi:M20 aminoacylase family protein [Pseudochelatococcus contaminans]|uniref:Hippurate hydrolase n=1 Tax=Pseudochelatococcus contaminans TaxID=1538103 RepID=A0A7W5Z418_9HYPH|nr:M20 aminoacylase family protein [Pseudochelatococcus contaminans]MBB3809372.1 hippurate hydrolase [Pseudochelatococcus contaminans]